MKTKHFAISGLFLGLAVLVVGCNYPMPNPASESQARFTQAAQTLQAQLTQTSAVSTPIGGTTGDTTGGAQTPFPTAQPTATKAPTKVPTPETCDWAKFVGDATVADGTT